MNSQFKKGVIELCVLKLISENDMYGLEVIKTLTDELDVSVNTIYPILRRLTKQGYFETSVHSGSIGAPKKYYKITKEGNEQLEIYEKDWLNFLSGVMKILGGTQI
jgi:PadR family transcriptional regulator PadR